MPPSRRGPVTATELKKELEDRYRNDPVYKASVDRQKAEHRARHGELRRAERPLVAALQSAGIPVDSAWELYKYPELGETAYPLLVKHLGRDYPDGIPNGIARAFTKDVTRTHWQDLLSIYLSDGRPEVRDGLAATLSGCARPNPFRRLDRDRREPGTWRVTDLLPTAVEPHRQSHECGMRAEGHRASRERPAVGHRGEQDPERTRAQRLIRASGSAAKRAVSGDQFLPRCHQARLPPCGSRCAYTW